MSGSEVHLIIDALTRATVRRDKLGVIGSDEDLIRRANADLDSTRVRLLVATGRLLRLMDGLLVGSESGEGFVEKFSVLWPSVKATHALDLAEEADALDEFYSSIHLFSASARDRREEPLLFGVDRLKELAEPIYSSLKRWWRSRLAANT
jgi:hypothetical protein